MDFLLLQSFDDNEGDDEDDDDYDEIVEKMYTLTDYLYQIKRKEVEYVNRLKNKGSKSKKLDNDDFENGISYSLSVSKSMTSNGISILSMRSGANFSSENNSESSSIMMSQIQG